MDINQRHLVYKTAKQLYEEFVDRGGAPDSDRSPFLCDNLKHAYRALFGYQGATGYDWFEIRDFTEFMKFKPEDASEHDHWWPISDWETRLKVLDECIKLTETI